LADRAKRTDRAIVCSTANDVAEAANADIIEANSTTDPHIFGKLASIVAERKRRGPKASSSALQLWPLPQTPP